jgi:hypothetical protein
MRWAWLSWGVSKNLRQLGLAKHANAVRATCDLEALVMCDSSSQVFQPKNGDTNATLLRNLDTDC